MSWPSVSRLRFVPFSSRPVGLPPGHLPSSRALVIRPPIACHSHSIPLSNQTPSGPPPTSCETHQPVATLEINYVRYFLPRCCAIRLSNKYQGTTHIKWRPSSFGHRCEDAHLSASAARPARTVESAPIFHLAWRKITLLQQFVFQSGPSKNSEHPRFGFSDGLLVQRSLVKCRSAHPVGWTFREISVRAK